MRKHTKIDFRGIYARFQGYSESGIISDESGIDQLLTD